jgi:hypothetical protein
MSLFGRLFRRRERQLDEVRASVVAIEPDGSAWATPWGWEAKGYAAVPLRRRDVKKLGLVFGTLVDLSIDPHSRKLRRVERMFSRTDSAL